MEIKGLDEEKVREISRLKEEPEWMCNFIFCLKFS